MGKKQRVPIEYLGAFKHGHRKAVREYIDEELSFELLERGDKKSLEALAWITKYNNEVYRGVLRKGDEDALHNTDALYKQASDSHNARRRDLTCCIRGGVLGPEAFLLSCTDGANDTLVEQFMNRTRDMNHEDTLIDLVSPKAAEKVKRLLARKNNKPRE